MAGIEGPTDGTSAALMNSLFGTVEGEGSLLHQMGVHVPGLFDVLQGQDGHGTQQQGKVDQNEGNTGAGVQAFMDEVSRGFMRSGSMSTGLVEQPTTQAEGGTAVHQGGVWQPPDPQKPPLAPSGSKELLDILSAQISATASAGRDVSLEELIASGHVSADTLLNLIESLKAILPVENSHQSASMPGQSLAALAEILGLNQGESHVPVSNQSTGPPAPQGMGREEGLLGLLGQQQQQRQLQHPHNLAFAGTPPRSNLGLGGSSGYSGSSSGGGPTGLGQGTPGSGSNPRPQASSLRTRRGLPDLPVHRPGAGRAGSQPLSPLSGSATPSPRSGKRVANGALPSGLGWPLSPASKSPRADGQMSPAGGQLAGGPLSLTNGPKYPPSPTTSLLGDLSKLAVHRPQTPPSGSLAAGGDVKLEAAMLNPAGGEGEGTNVEGAGDGGDMVPFEMDEFGDGEGGGGGEDRHGDSPGDGGAGGSGSGGRPKHSTKPRSVAERIRRERIAVRLQRLKEVMPKTDARIDTSAMLEDAVVYIRSLQSRCRALEKQNEMLTAQVARLSQQQQNGNLLQINQIMRPMGP